MSLVPSQKNKDVWAEIEGKLRHEPLPDLVGGNANGHYHLTLDELEHLHGLSEEIEDAIEGVKHGTAAFFRDIEIAAREGAALIHVVHH